MIKFGLYRKIIMNQIEIKKIWIILATITIVISLGASFISVATSSSNGKGLWTTKASMPTARAGHGVVSCNGKIYVIGGYNNSGFLDTVEAYDPISDKWETKAPLPYGIAEFGICAIGNEIYVIGGCNSLQGEDETIYPGNKLNSVLVYDTLSDSWSFKTPLPTPRISLALGVVDGKIYAIGGSELKWNDCCFYFYLALDTNEVYNPINDSWETLSPMITPRHHVGVAVINDKIFVCGGNKNEDLWPAVNIVEAYSPSTNTWESLALMPKRLTEFGITSVDDKFYIVGGLCYPEYHINDVFVYNPRNNQWSNISSMPTTRYGQGACAIDGKIYVIGGAVDGMRSIYSEQNNYLDKNEEFTPPLSNLTYNLSVNISYPSENALLSGSITVIGSASVTNETIYNVQIRIDSDSWITTNGTESWSYDLDTTDLKEGIHTISVRCYDGVGYSSIEMRNVTVQNIQELNDNDTPGFELISALCAFIIILFWKQKIKQ
jgi:N-acetylneuraminic acid mutarotase